ncbi:hypothetical protein [Photobacterium toruni]|uniref:hypothetical protein n=1 Tax=Photobacterium toruni TaxID=1935446 RepID=UPI00210F5825|nr:hypothetical protein [Photobacterium toruni]
MSIKNGVLFINYLYNESIRIINRRLPLLLNKIECNYYIEFPSSAYLAHSVTIKNMEKLRSVIQHAFIQLSSDETVKYLVRTLDQHMERIINTCKICMSKSIEALQVKAYEFDRMLSKFTDDFCRSSIEYRRAVKTYIEGTASLKFSIEIYLRSFPEYGEYCKETYLFKSI